MCVGRDQILRCYMLRVVFIQDGTLSPLLFNIYVNSMLDSLRSSDLGCHLRGKVHYLCRWRNSPILSASMNDMQSMVNICTDVALQQLLSSSFNSSKSKCIIIGPNRIDHKRSLCLNGQVLEFVDILKYLQGGAKKIPPCDCCQYFYKNFIQKFQMQQKLWHF